MFTKRIVSYNETFAPLGTKAQHSEKQKPYAVTWHEATTKRDADDICSAFIKWLQCQDIREKENLTVWLDNCNAQCKNWFIFTALFFFINLNATALKEIKLKYFEKGHTFMSVDSYHHMVEKAMKDLNIVYDFEDW